METKIKLIIDPETGDILEETSIYKPVLIYKEELDKKIPNLHYIQLDEQNFSVKKYVNKHLIKETQFFYSPTIEIKSAFKLDITGNYILPCDIKEADFINTKPFLMYEFNFLKGFKSIYLKSFFIVDNAVTNKPCKFTQNMNDPDASYLVWAYIEDNKVKFIKPFLSNLYDNGSICIGDNIINKPGITYFKKAENLAYHFTNSISNMDLIGTNNTYINFARFALDGKHCPNKELLHANLANISLNEEITYGIYEFLIRNFK